MPRCVLTQSLPDLIHIPGAAPPCPTSHRSARARTSRVTPPGRCRAPKTYGSHSKCDDPGRLRTWTSPFFRRSCRGRLLGSGIRNRPGPYPSGPLDSSILRPAMYRQAFDDAWEQARQTGSVVMPWSKHTQMTYVDCRGVADAAAIAFTDDRLSRGTFELAAGGMTDRVELAALIERRGGPDGDRGGPARRRAVAGPARGPDRDVRRLRPARLPRREPARPAHDPAAGPALGGGLHQRARPARVPDSGPSRTAPVANSTCRRRHPSRTMSLTRACAPVITKEFFDVVLRQIARLSFIRKKYS